MNAGRKRARPFSLPGETNDRTCSIFTRSADRLHGTDHSGTVTPEFHNPRPRKFISRPMPFYLSFEKRTIALIDEKQNLFCEIYRKIKRLSVRTVQLASDEFIFICEFDLRATILSHFHVVSEMTVYLITSHFATSLLLEGIFQQLSFTELSLYYGH